MNIILLSGGLGKRLWPLSNDIRSKQFIKIFKNDDGSYESMVQRMYHQILSVDREADITIATSKSQVSSIFNQLGTEIDICIEPCRRDTFPAIALASAYLHDVKGVIDDDVVVVCPVDPYVDEAYFNTLKILEANAKEGDASITLMGIVPTYPSEKYGYILPYTKEKISLVKEFKEKPDLNTAKKYIEAGGLWNGGVFAYKLGYMMNKSHELIDYDDYHDLYKKYETVEKISFDYAVVEKENNIQVIRFDGMWKDLGTWNTLTEAMEEQSIGDVTLNDTCENVHVINELDIPILGMGLKNIVVSASHDGIIVSDKEQSSYIKPYVDSFDQKIRFAEKSWGNYQVIDIGSESVTIKVTLNQGHRMNYHSHSRRDEVWTIISGEGRTIIDGIEKPVKVGDVITMKAGTKHTIIADTKLQIIEVQLGKEIDVADKQKYEDL